MSVGRWNFTERGQKYPCLMAQFALTITVPYNNTNGDVSIAVIKVPPTANVSADSTCGKLVLSWPMMNASTSSTPLFRTPDQVEIAFNNTFRVDAKTNNTTPIFQLANISAVFVYDQANESKGEFSPATHCSEDRRQSLETRMVPIVVASALGTLVLVVIIAFLIGRRHSRRDYGTVSN
ncbi:unnamed protein product [Notodromas monacha]|uniref:Lysosome-associated membrane glycoprotein 2-like transmembrane domain-containing protein n=1 Tax=Notodromas monacha TaxID=399045 RepID=A0A7R9BWX3_9CRUS|nr:unnamed protein product [Notodromas monacha]CAG0921622.1 unnamed protein product [Notodromas monacha]